MVRPYGSAEIRSPSAPDSLPPGDRTAFRVRGRHAWEPVARRLRRHGFSCLALAFNAAKHRVVVPITGVVLASRASQTPYPVKVRVPPLIQAQATVPEAATLSAISLYGLHRDRRRRQRSRRRRAMRCFHLERHLMNGGQEACPMSSKIGLLIVCECAGRRPAPVSWGTMPTQFAVLLGQG